MTDTGSHPTFSKIFLTSMILFFIGGVGIAGLIYFTQPTLGPRWLFFFFITVLVSGLALPFVFILQRRISRNRISSSVLIRETLWVAIFVDLIAWLQLGRVLNGLVFLLLFGGFVVIEILLRMSETAVFKPSGEEDERT